MKVEAKFEGSTAAAAQKAKSTDSHDDGIGSEYFHSSKSTLNLSFIFVS